ncbi:hypothetical protein [Streptomyces sp. AN091965]|uniref:hypothetical protein n=1 Tax=Streptomyces sp. AN091965 TaxID=2927803 RepID=UPI001F621E86|nr:hypothetical protein [Streptomyces sp. AN091965]MCI3928937.1 hypothetical protein [Streptomyces sp. AN091965]
MPPEPDPVTETFAFTCGDCGETWESTFRVMFFPDPAASADPAGSAVQEYVDEDGNALRSPLAAAVCPRCGGRTVHVMAPGFADRAHAAEHPPRPHHEHSLHLPHRHRAPGPPPGGGD